MREGYKSPCPHHRQCGGCQLQNLPYEQQLGYKQREAVRILGGFGHVEDIIGMDEPLHYRNKVHAAFGLDGRRRVVSGIYQPGSHAIVPVDECMIEDETADRIILSIKAKGLLSQMLSLPEDWDYEEYWCYRRKPAGFICGRLCKYRTMPL